jgi:hypothetical protein
MHWRLCLRITTWLACLLEHVAAVTLKRIYKLDRVEQKSFKSAKITAYTQDI